MHLVGSDQLQGFKERPVGDVAYSKVEDMKIDLDRLPKNPNDDRLNLRNSVKWSDEKELRRAGPGKSPTGYADELALTGFRHYVDSHLVGTVYDRHRPNHDYLLYLGTHAPHYPYFCKEELFRYYLPRMTDFEVETPFDHPFLGKSPWPQTPLEAGKDVPRRAVQRARAAYFGMIETMDSQMGEALDALRFANEELDDWIIVYLSDHGDMLGEHGIWEKQKFFEGSARVPFIIRAPKYLPQGITVSENVSLCDLFATLCDISGLETLEGLDSRSLVPLANGDSNDWNDEVCSSFLQQGYSNVMIKRGHLKYQWYEHELQGVMPELLFDLESDPLETANCINEHQYADALAYFRARKQELGH